VALGHADQIGPNWRMVATIFLILGVEAKSDGIDHRLFFSLPFAPDSIINDCRQRWPTTTMLSRLSLHLRVSGN